MKLKVLLGQKKKAIDLGNPGYRVHFPSPAKYGSTGERMLVMGNVLQGFISEAK